MGRRLIVAVIVAAIVGSTLIGAGEAAAAKKVPVLASGSLQCSAIGKVTYSPPLGATLVPTTTTITGKLTCSSTGIGSTPPVHGGKIRATSTVVGMSCSVRNIAEVNAQLSWKSKGNKVVPSTVNLGAGADATSFRLTTSAIEEDSSYEHTAMEITGTLTPPPCGKRGVKKSSFTATIDVSRSCDTNILTAFGFTYGEDQRFFWTVAPFCDYLPENHPTGTLTVSRPGGPPECSVSGPLVDTGVNRSFSPWDPSSPERPYTYWGVDSGMTVTELLTTCNVPVPQITTYTGDSRYRGFSSP